MVSLRKGDRFPARSRRTPSPFLWSRPRAACRGRSSLPEYPRFLSGRIWPGQRLAVDRVFRRRRDTASISIYAVAPGSGVVHKLTDSKPGEAHKEPALSRDGKLLAFVVDRDGISNRHLRKASRRDDARRRSPAVASSRSWPIHLPRPCLACRYRRTPLHCKKGFLVSRLWSVKIDATGRPLPHD